MAPETKENGKKGALTMLWRSLSSIRLSIYLFLALGGAAGIGTLVPQNQEAEIYIEAYGRLGYTLIHGLNIQDIYHAGWFRFLLVMLSVNITVCSIHRLSRTWKVIFPGKKQISFRGIEKTGIVESFTVALSPAEASARLAGVVQTGHGGFTIEKDEAEIRLLSEKGRLSRLGVYVVHLSVLLMLLGGLIGSMFGFDGSVRIPEGEARDRIQLIGGGERPLDFAIRCDDFKVTFYEQSRQPSEYRSSLTILENGREAAHKDIIVNDPLHHRGVSIFQSNYGMLPPQNVKLEIIRLAPRATYQLEAALGKTVELPDGLGALTVDEFRDHYMMGDHDIGETFIATLKPADRPAAGVVIPYPFPDIDLDDPMLKVLSTPLEPEAGQGVSLSFTSKASGMIFKQTMAMGEIYEIPENLGSFELREFRPAYDFMGHDMGPAYIGRLSSGDKKPEDVILPVRFAKFDRMRQSPVVIAVEEETGTAADTGLVVRVTGYEARFYTGLQVNRDPGVPLVYAGFALMILGCWVTFFMSHRKIGIRIAAEGGGSRVTIAGNADRNKPGMRIKVKRVAERIQKVMNS